MKLSYHNLQISSLSYNLRRPQRGILLRAIQKTGKDNYMAIQWIGNVTAEDTKDSIRKKIEKNFTFEESGSTLSYKGKLDDLHGFYDYSFYDSPPYHLRYVLFTVYLNTRESADDAYKGLKEKYKKLYGAPAVEDFWLREEPIEKHVVHIGETGWTDGTSRLIIMMEWDRHFKCYNVRVVTRHMKDA